MTRSDSEALLRSADRYGVMLLQLYPFKQSRSRCADERRAVRPNGQDFGVTLRQAQCGDAQLVAQGRLGSLSALSS